MGKSFREATWTSLSVLTLSMATDTCWERPWPPPTSQVPLLPFGELAPIARTAMSSSASCARPWTLMATERTTALATDWSRHRVPTLACSAVGAAKRIAIKKNKNLEPAFLFSLYHHDVFYLSVLYDRRLHHPRKRPFIYIIITTYKYNSTTHGLVTLTHDLLHNHKMYLRLVSSLFAVITSFAHAGESNDCELCMYDPIHSWFVASYNSSKQLYCYYYCFLWCLPVVYYIRSCSLLPVV